MRDQIVSFDTAKLAKEKGFNIIIANAHYDKDGKFWEGLYFEGTIEYIAPTQSLLQKWLREIEVPIVVEVNFGAIDDAESAYTWHIRHYTPDGVEGTRKKNESDFWKNYDSFVYTGGDWFSSYEQALEAGLQKALKLIKIINYERNKFIRIKSRSTKYKRQ